MFFASVLIAHQSKAKARGKAAGAQQEICIEHTPPTGK